MGKASTPSAIVNLVGRTSNNTPNYREPKPKVAPPPTPPGLSVREKKAWEYLVEKLVAVGVVTQVDGMGLELLVRHFGAYTRALKNLKIDEDFVSARDTESAWQKIAIAESMMMIRLMKEYGLTPSSRATIVASRVPDPTDDIEHLLDTGFLGK